VTAGDVRALTRAEAASIYRRFYWDAVRADALPPGLDHAVFDLAVNSGPPRASTLLQRVLGVAEDGLIGPITLEAARGRGWRARVTAVEREALALAAAAPAARPSPLPPQSPKGHTMTDMKSIFASRTVWTNIIGLVSVALALIGVDTGNLDVDRFAEAVAQLVAALSFIGSTVFRIAATRRLMG
jgi:lysozyme family protein